MVRTHTGPRARLLDLSLVAALAVLASGGCDSSPAAPDAGWSADAPGDPGGAGEEDAAWVVDGGAGGSPDGSPEGPADASADTSMGSDMGSDMSPDMGLDAGSAPSPDAGPALDADTGPAPDTDASPDGGSLTPTPRYADEVVEAPSATVPLGGGGFGDPALATNGVRGGGLGGGGMDVFSLGSGAADGYLVLRWSGVRVLDGPGVDLAVFENPFVVGDGPNTFMDPVIVEVSRDGQAWVPLPHDYTAPDETVYSSLPSHWPGFSGVHPVLYHEEDNPVDPLDPQVAGGDAYDLADLATAAQTDPEAAAILTDGFVYVRLVAATARTNPDTGQPYPHDPISNGPDIDGVYARYLAEAP